MSVAVCLSGVTEVFKLGPCTSPVYPDQGERIKVLIVKESDGEARGFAFRLLCKRTKMPPTKNATAFAPFLINTTGTDAHHCPKRELV